jgi:aspartyl-tRNA synthetase
MRSHYCGEITSKHLDKDIIICGWITKDEIMAGLYS